MAFDNKHPPVIHQNKMVQAIDLIGLVMESAISSLIDLDLQQKL